MKLPDKPKSTKEKIVEQVKKPSNIAIVGGIIAFLIVLNLLF